MKLAEALTERKALQEKLARLRARLTANARVQEGDEPAERPTALLAEVAEAATALENLTVRINRTNVAATLADEPRLTLMEAVARRDTRTREVALHCAQRVDRGGGTRVRALHRDALRG